MPLDLLDRAAVGSPITRAGVSLFPLYLHQGDLPPILTGPDAGVAIDERRDAEVPTLSVTSTADSAVLLVEGETVTGGRQNRTLNVSVLVPAGATIDLPVSCVEQGRWGGGVRFDRGASYAPRRVRRAKQEGVGRSVRHHGTKDADQGAVWMTVAHELTRLGADNDSKTLVGAAGADGALDRDRRLGDAIEDLTSRGPLAGQCGVVVTHGSRVVAAEVFASHDLLAEHWPALVRGHLLDAPETVRGRPSPTRALSFLHRIARATDTPAEAVGLGREHHLRSSRLVAQAITWDDLLVHASAFALAA